MNRMSKMPSENTVIRENGAGLGVPVPEPRVGAPVPVIGLVSAHFDTQWLTNPH